MTMATFTHMPFLSFAVCFPPLFAAFSIGAKMVSGSAPLYKVMCFKACAASSKEQVANNRFYEASGPRVWD
jgi:hypothetical protein